MERIRKFCILVSFLLLVASLGVEARADDPQGGLRIIPVRVEFIRPNSTCDYYKGETISIRFRLSRLPGASLPPGARAVKLTIFDVSGQAHPVPSVSLERGHPPITRFWIPNNIRPGSAVIRAYLEGEHGRVLSRSIGEARFKIHDNHSTILFERGGERVEVGERIRVSYRAQQRVLPCTIFFSLKRQGTGEVIGSVARRYTPVSPDQREPSYSFVFPESVNIREAGRYEVVATSSPPLFQGSVHIYELVYPVHRTRDPLSGSDLRMEVLSPGAGVAGMWSGGTLRSIVWRFNRLLSPMGFEIALEDSHGRKVLNIPALGFTFRGSDLTCILPWQVPEGLDGAYRIRITEVNSGVTARSGLFSIRGTGEPSLRFTSPGNGLVVHNNQTLPIRWEARNFPDRGTSREATVTILLVEPTGEIDVLARNIPVSRQSFTWTVDANRGPFDFRSRPETELVGVPPGRGRMGGISYPPGEYRLLMECPLYNIRLAGPRFRIR